MSTAFGYISMAVCSNKGKVFYERFSLSSSIV